MGASEGCLLLPPCPRNLMYEGKHHCNIFSAEHMQGQADLYVFIQHMVPMLSALPSTVPIRLKSVPFSLLHRWFFESWTKKDGLEWT